MIVLGGEEALLRRRGLELKDFHVIQILLIEIKVLAVAEVKGLIVLVVFLVAVELGRASPEGILETCRGRDSRLTRSLGEPHPLGGGMGLFKVVDELVQVLELEAAAHEIAKEAVLEPATEGGAQGRRGHGHGLVAPESRVGPERELIETVVQRDINVSWAIVLEGWLG